MNRFPGKFVEVLDLWAIWQRVAADWILYVILFPMVVFPLLGYLTVRDVLLRAFVPDKIWIVEENAAIFDDFLPAPQPMIDAEGKNAPAYQYYAEVKSITAAEAWAKEHGYERMEISHRAMAHSHAKKTFAVKRLRNSGAVSVLSLMIDKGDGYVYLAPFQNRPGKEPKFKSLPESKHPDLATDVVLRWVSTDGEYRLLERYPYETTRNYGEYNPTEWRRRLELYRDQTVSVQN